MYDHALVSDISRFYGTLYTHAIPWALHGKSWCKKNLNKPIYKATLGDQIDRAVRKGQDNQTIGIPIGPDTSRIISEIVGVAIDQTLQKELNLDKLKAFRHVDDWYIGFDNAGEAEDAIAVLSKACREFELELNTEKTQTIATANTVGALWPIELRQYKFALSAPAQSKSVEHYFTKAFEFALKFPDQNVLDFAVKRTKSLTVEKKGWHDYETILLKAARTNSTVLPAVVQIIVSYNSNGYLIEKNRISKLIEDLIVKSSPIAHHAEVAWALFLAKALKIKISRKSAVAVAGLESSICALLALDLRKLGLIDGKLNTSLWQQSMTSEGLLSNMWMLAYEADLKGWLVGNKKDFVAVDPYFGELKKKGIFFYDENKKCHTYK